MAARISVTRSVLAFPAMFARGVIRLYRYSLSSLVGRTCRHLPTCSEYTDEAIARHGLWRGGLGGLAPLLRCRPLGNHGFYPVSLMVPPNAVWYAPWRYGRWKAVATAQVRDDP